MAVGLGTDEPTNLMVDNQSAIALAYNPELHSRTKHIDRRHFFIRECVENMQLRVPFVPTKENVADFFTKPLQGKQFFYFRDLVMNIPADSPPELEGYPDPHDDKYMAAMKMQNL